MYIPQKMKNKVAEIFYDKTISIMETQTTIDAEGGVKYNGIQEMGTFQGNVNFSQCKKIQEEYGLDYEVEISVTTSQDVDVNINDIIKYQEITYNVTDLFKFDSHILLVGKKWRQ